MTRRIFAGGVAVVGVFAIAVTVHGSSRHPMAPPETAIAGLRLGTRLVAKFRCTKAKTLDDAEVTHQFRGAPGPEGAPEVLLVTTECPKTACASEDEWKIITIVVQTK